MSIQARLVRQLIRRSVKSPFVMGTIKNQAVPMEAASVGLRSTLERLAGLIAEPPHFVSVEDVEVNGIKGEWVSVPDSDRDSVMLYLHGGAYIFGSAQTHRNVAWRLAAKSHCRVLLLDYRLAPEHPWPAPVEDAVAAYDWLLEQGIDPKRIVIGGDSAGGGLTFATLAKLRDEKKPMPGVSFGISPWTDLAVTGPSMKTNARADHMFDPGAIPRAADVYLQGADPFHPYASPLYADPTGFPPTLIQVGSSELLLDDARRMAHNLRMAGVKTELEVWHDMPHVWHLFAAIMPESKQAIAKIGRFIRQNMTETAQIEHRKTAEIKQLPVRNRNGRQPSRAPQRHAAKAQ